MSLMTAFDIVAGLSYDTSLAPAARTASANGTGVDVSLADGPIIAIVAESAAGTGTTPTLAWTVEESDDNSTYAAVPADSLVDANGDATTFTGVTTAANKQVVRLRKQLLKKYIRVVATIGGTTPSFTCRAEIVSVKRFVN